LPSACITKRQRKKKGIEPSFFEDEVTTVRKGDGVTPTDCFFSILFFLSFGDSIPFPPEDYFASLVEKEPRKLLNMERERLTVGVEQDEE
jgi:hypothetical protein